MSDTAVFNPRVLCTYCGVEVKNITTSTFNGKVYSKPHIHTNCVEKFKTEFVVIMGKERANEYIGRLFVIAEK